MQLPEETLSQIYDIYSDIVAVEKAIDELDEALEAIDDGFEYFDRFENDMELLKSTFDDIRTELDRYEHQMEDWIL